MAQLGNKNIGLRNRHFETVLQRAVPSLGTVLLVALLHWDTYVVWLVVVPRTDIGAQDLSSP